MPVPSYRVPVKIARGTYANLSANLASLEEGEIVYANDENALYVVEGGVLTKSSADLGISSIDDLGDVDTSTAAPTDGQALVWNNANGEWVPGTVATATPDLDAVTTVGATTNNDLSVGDLLTVLGDGTSQDGRLRLNCSANTHGVTIQSPPHSDAATYSFILPSSAGTAGQVLTSQAGAQLTWEDAVDSVNGQTNAVVLDLEDLNNVLDLAPTVYQFIGTSAATIPTQAGGEFYASGSSSEAWFDNVDENGADFATIALTKVIGDPIWISTDGVNFTEYALAASDVVVSFGAIKVRLNTLSGWPNSYNGGNLNDVYISWSDPSVTTPDDGQVLTWVNASGQWEPADLQGSTVRAALGIGEYADDTAAGTGGVASGAMYYNTTSSDYRLKA